MAAARGAANGSSRRNILARALVAAAAATGFLAATPGSAQQSEECARLQAAIAAAPRGGGGGAAAAAERQRQQLASTRAYAHSIGCDNQRFLFFGSDPPPQCGDIRGQIARMQANLASLQARAGGGRADLIARYNAVCANPQPGNFFQALFGIGNRQAAINPEEIPPDEQQQMLENSIENEKKGAHVSAGSYAVCVRTCDGSFFPVSYSGAGRADSLEEECRLLCPNTEVRLYSFPFGGTINQAVSSDGEPYVNLPNALKFQQTYDPECSCRRKGESWAQALAAAEARYGHESRDILVTPEKSAELSRPILSKSPADQKGKPGKPSAKAAGQATDANAANAAAPGDAAASNASPSIPGAATGLDANGTDTALSAAAAAVSRETSGIGGVVQSGTVYGRGDGKVVTEKGPDGVTRKVRIVAPTL